MDDRRAKVLGRPPWKWAPEYPVGSPFWRMGAGEDYLDTWIELFRALSLEERRAYLNQHRPPPDWSRKIGYITGELKFEIDWGDDGSSTE